MECDEAMKPQHIGMVVYGLQNMPIWFERLWPFVAAMIQTVDKCSDEFTEPVAKFVMISLQKILANVESGVRDQTIFQMLARTLASKVWHC